MMRRPPSSTLFPYTPLSRSLLALATLLPGARLGAQGARQAAGIPAGCTYTTCALRAEPGFLGGRLVRGTSGERVSTLDRKSTRLNSSHANISYAVFCLKKKK